MRGPVFPIVGIGGSAGGLEAFTEFLENLPADTGMAFIFVQHLDPTHESELPRILSRMTTMPVSEAAQGTAVRPNQAYVIPPNVTLSLRSGCFELVPREVSLAPHLSIDYFFASLAAEQAERAIGVVFSGSATDGTNGLEAIKAAGGITFAQDASARHGSMPRTAVASGCVDYVMAPKAVAQELVRIAAHPYVRDTASHVDEDSLAPKRRASAGPKGGAPRKGRGTGAIGFARIVELLLAHAGVDFSLYKANTIQRRIDRRMLLSRRNTLDDYAQLVGEDKKELKALFADMLVGVTSFFRDEAAFALLQKTVIPRLIRENEKGSIRIWTIGCSSGQEAYSLAIAFLEVAEASGERAPKLQVFGTDLNDAQLTKARHGLYPKTLAHEISTERLRKYFVEEDGGYRVIKRVREICIFGRQDILADPPFSRMDLVACRNVLIYIELAAQKRVLPMLHYALKPGGALFLGSSDSVGPFGNLFAPADKKQKVFLRQSATTPTFALPVRDRRDPEAKPPAGVRTAAAPDDQGRGELLAHQEADRVMMKFFAPPGVLVDANLNVLQFRGATEDYLTSPSGKASFELLKLARESLVLPLRAAIKRARTENEAVRREKIPLSGAAVGTVDLHVIPLKNLRAPCFLVLFENAHWRNRALRPPDAPEVPAGRAAERALRTRNAELVRELRETRDYLQSLQQQHDTAHEELQASNEEVQSTNEELQSINEELETSKEELESGNEELLAVNEEMAYRNGELSRLNSDLNNFHVSLSTPIVVLGRDLTIRRFTPLAEKLFNLIASDVGRPIGAINHNLEFQHLEPFIAQVIELLVVRETEVRDRQGYWYLLRARPYLTVDNKIDGAILVLLDIDALKRGEQAMMQERDYAEAALRTARDALIILRPDLTVYTANEAFYRTFQLKPAHVENRLLFDLADGAWDVPALRALLADVLPRDHVFNDLEITHAVGTLGVRTMRLNGRRLESVDGAPLRIVLAIEDVTERLKSRAVLRASEQRYRRLFEMANDGVLTVDAETRRIIDANPYFSRLLGYAREELLGKELFEIGLFDDAHLAQAMFLELRAKREIRYDNLPLKGRDGVAREVEVAASYYDEEGRAVIQFNVRDFTQRKRMEDALRRSESRFAAIIGQATAGIAELDLAGKFTLVNERFCALVGRTEAELLGLHSHEITHEEDRVAPPLRFTGLSRGRADYSVEKRYVRPDGTIVWVSNSLAWITGRDDVPHGFVEIAQDISERKRLEAALQTSEAYFRELTQTLPIGVWTSLPYGLVDFINQHWLAYTGQVLDEAKMHTDAWMSALHPDDRGRAEAALAEARATGSGYSIEARFRQASTGHYRWFLLRSVPVHDAEGRLQKRIDLCIDVDDLKRAQNILADHAGELEAQVRARTAELRETIGELEAFSYSVSHDMRAPLRALQGFALTLLHNNATTLDPASLDQLRRIGTSANRMDALINDVLTYSRLLRTEIVLTPVNLDELVRNVIATYPQLHAVADGIVLEGTLPTVRANEASLTQCISNLLSNAVKFVLRGVAPHVRVYAEQDEETVTVWIVDNGIGIDPRDHARIWNIFTQIGRAGDYPGTGIGLAIVRKSVERMDGRIGLESTLGAGSKFWFRLRRA